MAESAQPCGFTARYQFYLEVDILRPSASELSARRVNSSSSPLSTFNCPLAVIPNAGTKSHPLPAPNTPAPPTALAPSPAPPQYFPPPANHSIAPLPHE